jgi:hypothetical protein
MSMPGNLEGAVMPHGLAERGGLAAQVGSSIMWPGQRNAVARAPAADRVGKRLGEALADVVVIAVAPDGGALAGQFPEHLGQVIKQIAATPAWNVCGRSSVKGITRWVRSVRTAEAVSCG